MMPPEAVRMPQEGLCSIYGINVFRAEAGLVGGLEGRREGASFMHIFHYQASSKVGNLASPFFAGNGPHTHF